MAKKYKNFTFDLGIRWPCGHYVAFDFVEMGKQFVILVAKLIKNAISILRPLVYENFGRITVYFLRNIPIGEKMVGKWNIVSFKATASTLLGKRTFSVDRVV